MFGKIEQLLQDFFVKQYAIMDMNIQLEMPPSSELGDVCFGAFVLSKTLKKNPALLALEIVETLPLGDTIISAKAVGPYVNLTLSNEFFIQMLDAFTLQMAHDDYFHSAHTQKNIVIDYIGANVGKPLHIGHMCTPNQGQAMINIYKKLGYNVISDSHIGDWGIIFGKLICAYKLWGDEAKLQENAVDYLLELYIKISQEAKSDETFEEKARNAFKMLSSGDKESVKLWELFTKYSICAMNTQLARLGVKPDYNIGENFYEGIGLPKIENFPDLIWGMKDIVAELVEKGIASKNEDGSVGVVFSDESKLPSCVLQKRDGTHGYLASDLACIKYRMHNWNPEKIVYFVDGRQQLHFKQAFDIAYRAGWVSENVLFHAFNGFIALKDGAMSTRDGRIIRLEALLDEAEKRAKDIILEKREDMGDVEIGGLAKMIGIGAIKYGYLKKSRETDVIFDWDEFMTFEGNSGPYIQYSYVRALRILEKMGDIDVQMNNYEGAVFEFSEEKELVMAFGEYKKVLLETADKNMPHVLCHYIYGLTKKFNAFYNNVPVLTEERRETRALRLVCVSLFSKILFDACELIGILMPNKM